MERLFKPLVKALWTTVVTLTQQISVGHSTLRAPRLSTRFESLRRSGAQSLDDARAGVRHSPPLIGDGCKACPRRTSPRSTSQLIVRTIFLVGDTHASQCFHRRMLNDPYSARCRGSCG